MTRTSFSRSTWGQAVIRSDLGASVGRPSLDLEGDLIATVLDLLRVGWTAVCVSGEIMPDSTEPQIARRLSREMISEKKRRGINRLRFEEEVGTVSSPDAIRVEGRIDVKVIYSFDENEYFGIECKRVSGRRGDGLADKYVDEGIARFVSGRYSPGHRWAAMSGFVIDGEVVRSVELVAAAVVSKKRAIALVEGWATEDRFGRQEHLYRTRHRQSGRDSHINLLHFFLAMNPQDKHSQPTRTGRSTMGN